MSKISFWSRKIKGDRLSISYVAGVERGRYHVEIQETRRNADEASSLKKEEKEVRNLDTINFTLTPPKILNT